MEQYDALANEAPPGPVAHPFRYQANEELEHKRELDEDVLRNRAQWWRLTI